MKMKIVSAFNVQRTPAYKLVFKPELEGKTASSFNGIAKLLVEGDAATVEVANKGYKQVSIENGTVYIQRNYAFEY